MAIAGVVTFDAMSAYCWPLGNMTIQFQAQPSGFDPSYHVTTTLILVFRQCHDGDVLVNNACQACPFGSYSFQYDPAGLCVDIYPTSIHVLDPLHPSYLSYHYNAWMCSNMHSMSCQHGQLCGRLDHCVTRLLAH